jgi:hypothetical protein
MAKSPRPSRAASISGRRLTSWRPDLEPAGAGGRSARSTRTARSAPSWSPGPQGSRDVSARGRIKLINLGLESPSPAPVRPRGRMTVLAASANRRNIALARASADDDRRP